MMARSTRSNYFGKSPLRGSSLSRKKISPVLERENLGLAKISPAPAMLRYNQQSILMPPVKKPLRDFNKRNMNFLKVSLAHINLFHWRWMTLWNVFQEKTVVARGERESNLLSKQNGNNTQLVLESKVKQSENESSHANLKEKQSFKQRIHLIEITMAKRSNFVDELIKNSDSKGEDILSNIVMCKSAKYLQKYGCLHSDHGSDRWKF